MSSAPSYDAIADWYEREFLARSRGLSEHPLGIDHALRALLGRGSGSCLEIGCGTGEWAALIRNLGRAPVGVDVSAGMLSYAKDRLPVIRGDAEHLPFASSTLPAVITVMAHTDMPRYPDVLAEAARVLRPGGVFVHVGVHPCFCGGFADRSDSAAVVIRPGYLDSKWTTESWTSRGVRARVGAWHWPLPELSVAMGIGSSTHSPHSASTPTSSAKPTAPMPIRRFAKRLPDSSTTATPWWSSAQSIPDVEPS
jgi:SAM-dependent methyltransferase